MSIQYNIKYSSMNQLFTQIVSRNEEWYNQLGEWRAAYSAVINMTDFTGQSAVAIKNYLGDVHEFLLQSIYTAIMRLQSDYLMYLDQYYSIEGNCYAAMPQQVIKEIENRLSNETTYLNNISDEINRDLNSIEDIFGYRRPDKLQLENCLQNERDTLAMLNRNIEDYENHMYTVANGELKELLIAIKNTIALYINSPNDVLSYRSGDIGRYAQAQDLYQKVQDSMVYINSRQEEIELAASHQQEVFEQMQKDYEEACEARVDQGRVKIITGAAAVVVGGAAIICTGGAATPIVVTAYVTGACSAAYGVSSIVEGGFDVGYGCLGDINSKAFNPIRDTVFMGNQNAYDKWGNLNMTVAGLCIPVSQAVNGVAGTGKSLLMTAAKTAGKELVKDKAFDFVSSGLTGIAAEKFGLNQTGATLLNMVISTGLDKGADAVEAKIMGEAPFAEGMSYEDAARYNKYWADVEAGIDTTHPGMTDLDAKRWNLADSKVNEAIAVNKVDADSVLELKAQNARIPDGGLDVPGVKTGEHIAVNKLDVDAADGVKILDGGIKEGSVECESGKYSILSYEDAENIAFDAIHGPNNADAVVLGKYGDGGPTAYTSVAKDMDAQYFQLDNWDELAARYSDDEIWKINEKFLDIQTSSGREIYLSHNPEDYLGKGQFYSRELQYLLDNGYKFVDEGGIWHAVR